MKKVASLKLLILVAFFLPQISADTREIRNGHGGSLPPEEEEETEPASEDLKAELRMPNPLAHSEVIQLLGDDETRSHELGPPAKHPNSQMDNGRMDCSKITMQIFQVLLQNPDSVEPEDYSCGLLNLISHFEKSHGRIRNLETSLHTATSQIKTLETTLQAEMSKNQFLMKELNETFHKETERAIKAENVIARRVLAEKARVDVMQKNITEMLTSAIVEIKEFEVILKDMERQWDTLSVNSQSGMPKAPEIALPPQSPPSLFTDQDIQKIELKLSSLHDFIKDLSNRISQMEDGSEEHVNKGITQIFKTYASLANEIEKETERATGEEQSLKSLISTEISTLAKQIHALQERITEEKNRVQVIENRRTADLFEEINRAKSEENRLGQKLKDEMSKAAAAFKRLEVHVDTQLNSTKLFEDDLKVVTENMTRTTSELEERLTEQLNFERTRALSVENSLKVHLETEVSRAMASEESIKKLVTEERERARAAEHELKVANDVETYRAKGVEYSISTQLNAESERAKLEEGILREEFKSNVTLLLTDIIKEYTRASSAEKELDDRITAEITRAISVEQGLATSLNSEHGRASERENELYRMFKVHENSTELKDELKFLIQTEAARAQKAESSLEGQIFGEISRAQGSEETMRSLMNDELMHFKSVEHNLTTMSQEIVRHTRELELEVRKTVMAEVARAVDAENSIKYQLAMEVERATMAERAISSFQATNYSDVSVRLQDLTQELEKDTLKLEDLSLQISRNLTGDILTLAELFDDKLDDLERSENVRLKKLEDEMKKCCSTSSWRWRSPSSSKGKSTPNKTSRAEGVISKIMQVFGALPESDSGGKRRKGSRNQSNEDDEESSEGRAIGGGGGVAYENEFVAEEKTGEESPKIVEIVQKKVETKTRASKLRSNFESHYDPTSKKNETVQIIYGNPVSELELEKRPDRTKSYRTMARGSRKSDRNSNMESRNSVVSVQTANSKVTSTYG